MGVRCNLKYAEGFMSDKNNWKKFLLNSIIVLVYLGIAVFCVVTVLVNNDNMQEVQKAAVPLENLSLIHI